MGGSARLEEGTMTTIVRRRGALTASAPARPVSGTCVVAVVLLATISIAWTGVARASQTYSAEQVEAELTPNAVGLGPRCTDRAHWGGARVRQATGRIVALAEAALRDGFAQWSDEAYLEYSRSGTRINFEKIIFDRQDKLFQLALAACVTGQQKYLTGLENLLTSVAAQPSWTLSASDPKLENFHGRYSVELNAAELAAEIGQLLYLLEGMLDRDVERLLKAKIAERVINPVFAQLDRGTGPFWLHEVNNWNAVCLSGFVTAVLTTVDDPKKRAQAIATAHRFTENFLNSFGPDGYAGEGVTYWGYGFSRYSLLRAYVLRATGGKVDFYARPRVRHIALFPYRFQMSPGSVAAFGDALKGQAPDGFTMIYAEHALKLGMKPLPARLPVNPRSVRFTSLALFEENKVVESDGGPQAGYPQPPHDYFEDAQVLVGRPGGPGSNRLAYTLKAAGGGPHSHDDIGSYVVALCGKQVMGDPGRFIYYSKDLHDRRNTKVLNSFGHPVPLVDGDMQTIDVVKGDRADVKLMLSESVDRVTVDLAKFYKTARPKALTREYTYDRRDRGTFQVEDKVTFADRGAFDTAITTDLEFKFDGRDTVTLGAAGRAGTLKISASFDFKVEIEAIEKNGLRFSRLGIATIEKIASGWVRYAYQPPASGGCP
jgi:hypothetical protein